MTSELWRRIAFTLGALLLYRLGTYIPLPGLDATILSEIVRGGRAFRSRGFPPHHDRWAFVSRRRRGPRESPELWPREHLSSLSSQFLILLPG